MNIDSILPIVRGFFRDITPEQWNLLKSGNPDAATITFLGEKLLEIVIVLTQSLLKNVQKTSVPVSVESVSSSLGNILPQAFARALDVPDEGKSVNSEHLTQLTAKEITECINSVLSTDVDNIKAMPRVIAPNRLQDMINQAGKMIRGLMKNLKYLCTTSKSKRKGDQRQTIEDGVQSTLQKPMSDRESLVTSTSKTVQEIITKEISLFKRPTADEIADSQYEQIESGTSLDIKNVSDEVAEMIVDEIIYMQDKENPGAAQSSPMMKKVSVRIRTCMAKRFAQSFICCIVGKLNNTYLDGPEEDKAKKVTVSVQSVMTDLDALLPIGEIKPEQNGSKWFHDIFSGKTKVYTEELIEILTAHIQRMKIQITSESKRMEEKCPAWSAISSDILARVWCFLGVMRWWLHTQSESLTSRVITNALENVASVSLLSGAQAPTVEGQKFHIRIIVQKLVSRIFAKAKMLNTLRSPNTISEQLLTNIWNEIKNEDIEMTADKMKHLHKTIFKEITQKWPTCLIVLIQLELEDQTLINFIVSSFKRRLIRQPKKTSAFYRFFSLFK